MWRICFAHTRLSVSQNGRPARGTRLYQKSAIIPFLPILCLSVAECAALRVRECMCVFVCVWHVTVAQKVEAELAFAVIDKRFHASNAIASANAVSVSPDYRLCGVDK